MKFNPVNATDAYKVTHWAQRPTELDFFYDYGEARKGGVYPATIHFGTNYIIKEYFMKKITQSDIDAAKLRSFKTFGTDNYFNEDIWKKVLNLGYFPLRIKTAPEGMLIPASNVLFTIESTEKWFAPMVSHFEDWLMWHWYPTAVATRSFYIRKNITPYFEKSCENLAMLDFAVNDFGYRGGTMNEGATLGGMAHLISFDGTDNLSACENIKEYYNFTDAGKSVWATEHSVATIFGKGEGEYQYILTQIERAPANATLSIVIDSYDSDNFMYNVLARKDVKEAILNRPGKVVFRPDSGTPEINVLKYTEALAANFGFHINSKNYKALNPCVGIIQGDGMNEISIPNLYKIYTDAGWAADNLLTGSGGGLLEEGLNRDTNRFAVKVSYAELGGKSTNVAKNPKTDTSKSSKSGKLKLHYSNNAFTTLASSEETSIMFNSYVDSLQTIYENGNLLLDENFETIRKRARHFL